MKRFLIILCAALLLAGVLGTPALAFSFNEANFTLEIPERDNVYYYTQKGTNMTGTMLENAQKQDVLCLIGEYDAGGTLLYTFKAEQAEETAAEAAVWLAESMTGYELGEAEPTELNGREGLLLSGRSLQNPNYQVNIHLLGDSPSVVFTITQRADAEQTAMALLSSVEWPNMDRDPEAVPLPSEGEPAQPTEEPAPEQPTEPDAPAALAPVEEEPGLLERLGEFSTGHRGAVLGLAAGLLAIAIVLLVVLLAGKGRRYRPRHTRKR